MTNGDSVLNPHSARDYLVEKHLMRSDEEVSIRPLGGSVSNLVLLVEWRPPEERRWVLKQSLGKSDVMADWRSDRSRIFHEVLSLRKLRPVLGPAALPEVVHTDNERFLYIMTAAPEGSQSWKELLLARRADSQIARNAGTLLAKIINASREDATLSGEFWDRAVFYQLRVEPDYRTTASRHPELRREFHDLITTSINIRTSLVHGGFSPENMLVLGENIFLIDFEVVHWGDPSFDAAFLMNHLFLKAFHQPAVGEQFIALVYDYWRALLAGLGPTAAMGLEFMTLRHLGGLMLACIDGKSPVEYIRDSETKERVRKAARRILVEGPRNLEHAADIVKGEIKM
jgi:5-methylthioribose kinase